MVCVSELFWRAQLPCRTARAVQVHQQILRPGVFTTQYYSTVEVLWYMMAQYRDLMVCFVFILYSRDQCEVSKSLLTENVKG